MYMNPSIVNWLKTWNRLMIIKRLIIENFRSYYGRKEFIFGNKLNLILGSNGDGKSTLFEAINWVLTYKATDVDALPNIETLVSAKFFKNLPKNTPEPVRVTLEMNTYTGQPRKLVREFYVVKREDGTMFTSKHTHRAYQKIGALEKERILTDVLEKEGVFPAKIKKFSILQGEERLNIFEDPISFVCKAELKKVPIIRTFIYLLDGLYLERDNLRQEIKTMKEVQKQMNKKKVRYIIFPEGTRTKDGSVGKFYSAGFRKLTESTGLPVVVCALDGGWQLRDLKKFFYNINKGCYRVKVLKVYDSPKTKEECNKILEESKIMIENQVKEWRSMPANQR